MHSRGGRIGGRGPCASSVSAIRGLKPRVAGVEDFACTPVTPLLPTVPTDCGVMAYTEARIV
jgi:hypothetical protein